MATGLVNYLFGFRSRSGCRPEESGRFLKKAAQKLLVRRVMGIVADNARDPA
jgi:hypothetical protein